MFHPNVKVLKSLSQMPKEWGLLFLHIVTTKLDINTLREWEIESPKLKVSIIEQLFEFLENRCLTLKAIESLKSVYKFS